MSKTSVIGVSAAALLAVVALCVPLIPGAGSVPILVMLQSFRALVVLGVLVLILAISLLLLWRKKRQAALVTGLLASVMAAALIFTVGAGASSSDSVPASSTSNQDELRILSWNTDQASVDDDLIELVRQTQPDIVVLPEYFSMSGLTLPSRHPELAGMNAYGWDSSAATILIAKELGTYRLDNDDTPPWAGFYLVPEDAGSDSPKIVVAHLQRPMLIKGSDLWQMHMDWVRERCDGENVIAVGDFNATLASVGSESVGSCKSVSSSLGQRDTGTWPTWMPAALGAQIDHVFVGDAWTARWFGVLNAPGMQWSESSDHRPIFAVVERT